MHKTRGGGERQGELLGVIAGLEPGAIQAVLRERAQQAALTMAVALLEQDAEALCGQRYERKQIGLGYRGGHEQTSVVVEGAKYALQRPRVRKNNQAIPLPTLAKLQRQDLLDAQMQQRMVLGGSTRNYEAVIDGDSEKLGVTRSSVSRAFIRASQKDLDSINEGKLDDHPFVALLIDSVEIGRRTVVAALGVTAAMEKIPVGLCEGETENSEVVKDLLASLHERGFTPHCERLLAVIDEAKALKKALRDVFGTRVVRPLLAPQGAQPPGLSARASARHATLATQETDGAQLADGRPHEAGGAPQVGRGALGSGRRVFGRSR